jgi:hypothetical protein
MNIIGLSNELEQAYVRRIITREEVKQLYIFITTQKEVNTMAFDRTALQTAVAEGRLDEGKANELIAKFDEVEMETAKALVAKVEEAPAEPVQEQAAEVTPPAPEEVAA